MPQSFLEKRRKQRNLIVVFGAVLLITASVFWFGFRKKAEPTFQSIEELLPHGPDVGQVDFELLTNSLLEELEPFEEFAPFEETEEQRLGRKNPFLPY